jgi:hypothetical protein
MLNRPLEEILMRPSTLPAILLSLMLAACAGDNSATAPRPGSASRTVAGAATRNASAEPLTGTCASQDAQAPVFTPPFFLDQVIAGTCQFSKLGRTNMRLLQQVNLFTGAAIGTVTFTAANGDALNVTQSSASADIGPMRKSFTGTAVIAGGSGRFADASGGLELEGTLTFDLQGIGHAFSTYTGRLVYDASDRGAESHP